LPTIGYMSGRYYFFCPRAIGILVYYRNFRILSKFEAAHLCYEANLFENHSFLLWSDK
jgi:hypothetical protein